MYALINGQDQKGFEGTLHKLTPGNHQITIKVADYDHDVREASDSIEIAVK